MKPSTHVGALALQVELWSGAVFQNIDGNLYVAELDGPLSPFLRDSIQAHTTELLRLVQSSEVAADEVIQRAQSPWTSGPRAR